MRELWVRNGRGKRMLVRAHGDPRDRRTPILGLPGYARTGRDFGHMAGALAPRRLITLDYRGRGRSDREDDPAAYHPITLLDDIRHVLIATGCHRVVVIGTSLGGLLAMGMAVAMPMTVQAVLLNDVGPDVEDGGTDRIVDYIGRDHHPADWPAAVALLKTMMPNLSFKSEADWLTFAEHTFREDADGRLHVDWDTRIIEPLITARAAGEDLWPLFRALRRVPVLAVRGGVSEVLSAATFDRMAREHPAMETVTLDGVGHAPALTEPELRDPIERFLAAS